MNVNSPEFLKNPYPFYDERRRDNPAFKRDDTTWTLTGYQVLSSVLANSRIGRGNVGQKPRPQGDMSELNEIKHDNLALQIMENWMLFQNPPVHTANRKMIADVFTIKMIEQFEALMRLTIQRQIADIKRNYSENQPFDLIEHIAYPYPSAVICEILGIPAADQQKFAEWTKTFSLGAQVDFINIPPPLRSKLNQTAAQFKDYFEKLYKAKSEQSDNSLMSRLIQESGRSTSDMQLLSNCIFLLFAGQETTTLMLSNTVHALLSNPEQLSLLRSKPELIKNAIEECLRYDTSTQMIGRFALEDVQIGELEINKGDHIFAFLGAAGRDPEANSDPHTFDISRDKIKHLVFARGAHHCLGASLARLEIRVFLEELLDAFSYLSLAGHGERRSTWLMRGFDRLPISYQSRPPVQAEKITLKFGSGLYPFQPQELMCTKFGDYQLENVFESISDDQRHACVKMWMKHNVLPTKEMAWKRSKQVCYIFSDLKTGDIIGVNTLYQDQLTSSSKQFFFNRMYILPEYRNSRLMIRGTAAMLCFAKHNLSNRGVAGVVNVNENSKLDRPGLQSIFNRLGYRHFGWQGEKEIILFEFDRIHYAS